MRFADFLHVQIHSWNAASRPDEVQGSRNVDIPRMDLDTEKTRETHNLYIKIKNFISKS